MPSHEVVKTGQYANAFVKNGEHHGSDGHQRTKIPSTNTDCSSRIRSHSVLLALLREEAEALDDPLLLLFYDMTIQRTKDGPGIGDVG